LGNDITACVPLVSLCIEDPSPIWPLQDEATGSVVDLLTPSIVWLSPGLGSPHASIDAILATNKHSNVSELVLERQVVNDKPIKLKASGVKPSIAIQERRRKDLLQWERNWLFDARCNPCLADAVVVEILAISKAPVQTTLPVVASISF
jgi:hypothetical protein